MLSDQIRANIDRITAMGREAIAKTHAVGQSAVVSVGPGRYVRIFPDGTRAVEELPQPVSDDI